MPASNNLGFPSDIPEGPAMSGLEARGIQGQSAITRFSFLNLIWVHELGGIMMMFY